MLSAPQDKLRESCTLEAVSIHSRNQNTLAPIHQIGSYSYEVGKSREC
jgi:hypothetical protein